MDKLDKILDETFKEMQSVPEGFEVIINDFVNDINITFPEYKPIIQKWWHSDTEEGRAAQTRAVFDHCVKIIPLKTFDIINEREELFAKTNNTEFLPNILFSYLWESEITNNTRKIIWKYLNAILLSILTSIKMNDFTMKDEELKKMCEILKSHELEESKETDLKEDLKETMKEMTNGKIGKLAIELAEETVKSLNMEENPSGMMDLLKDPSKLMSIVQNMGSKLDEKMKTGDLDENDIISEGIDLMKKMKDVPGLGDMSELFKMFENLPDMNNAQKGAFNSHVKQNAKLEATKARLRKKQASKANDPEIECIENLKNTFEKNGKKKK